MRKALLSFAILVTGILTFAQTSNLNRPNDPVVLTGADVPAFSALSPDQIVGFKFENGTWTQIPIQIDERALLDIVTPYGSFAGSAGYPPSPSNPKLLFYCDPNTNVGEDADTTFDADDELVFMAKDAGGLSDGSYPPNVVTGSCQQILITDPLGGAGYVYLFQNDGGIQGTGTSYVTLTSNLIFTAGFPVNLNSRNNENTTIATAKYSWHFAAEWICDEFKISLGNNVDILDRYKNFFADGYCGRQENSFSDAENAFICTKAGPVRTIRSYMGANSGPLTQRTHWFYEGRQDIATDLRVHSIPSVFDVFDYNSNANGMTYRNNNNTNGVTINGQQDVLATGPINWEQISGTPGMVSVLYELSTTLSSSEATFANYYDDNSSNPASNCTGDGQAWGTSGVGFIFGTSACTDPVSSNCSPTNLRTLRTTRIMYADSASALSTTAANYYTNQQNPLTLTIASCTAPVNYIVITFANPVAGGTTSGDGTYASGTPATVTATANSGYVFTNWTDNGTVVSTNASYTFNVFANTDLIAHFAVSNTNYTVATSANPVAGGTTSGDGTYAGGTAVSVSATANSGYTFTNWTEGGTVVSTNANYSFNIAADRTLVANFTQNATLYTITLTSDPTNGGITTGQGSYPDGTLVSVSATALPNYVFQGWKENGNIVSTDSVYTFTLTANRDLTASFSFYEGIKETFLNPVSISVYPNPTTGKIMMAMDGEYSLKVLNPLGQVILQRDSVTSQSEITLPETGIYLLQFTDAKGARLVKRIVVH